MFYIWHGFAIIALSVSSFGIGYTVAKDSVKSILFKKEK